MTAIRLNRRPTQNDVAQRAGVSQATVSLILNKVSNSNIPEETRMRVEKAIEDLGYRPNTLASSLRLGKTHTLGLILPDSANPFFAEVSRSIENAAFEQNYNLILCNTEGDIKKELLYVDVLCNRQVDGIIFVAVGDQVDSLQRVLCKHIPAVMIDRDLPGLEVDAVLTDNFQGGFLATQHLIQLGHRRIGCIAGPSSITPSAGRGEGYMAALAEYSIPTDEKIFLRGDFHPHSGWASASTMLTLREPPTAIFAGNDLMAIGALRAITEAGLRVPEDISLVGFDNIELASYTNPPLTTVIQPIQEAGQKAVDFLIERIREPGSSYKRAILPTSLIVRDSSRKVYFQPVSTIS
jgi:LacI family transcriptional regulator